MAHVDTHSPGSFCWFELGTTDQNAAKEFYQSVLGWSAEDFPISGGEFYTMFTLEGRYTGACYTLRPDMRERGVPPHWLAYVATANADETAAKAVAAGGKLVDQPFDVMQFGRMVVLQDPTDAILAAWQAKTHHGTGIQGVPGTMCWADLVTTDPDRAVKFYNAAFGWVAEPGKDDSGYLHIKNGEHYLGGIPPAQHKPANVRSHWLLYFLVQDCDASTEKAGAAGAKVLMAPMSMEGVGRWSIIADPQGAVCALFQQHAAS